MLEEPAGESRDANSIEGALTTDGINEIDSMDRVDKGSKLEIGNSNDLSVPPSMEIDHLQFQYAPDSFKLETGRIQFKPGEHIAIVGKSGSGKTTLLHLIAGLLKPESGTLLVNGSPLSQYDETEWFEHVSYITQHPYIFAGTFSENIAIGARGSISRAEIERAGEEAGLTALTAQLEHGFDTFVGEGGRGLSGGEKQRLALARAF